MYLDALSFLEDERDAFRPFEALLDLSDEQLDRPVEEAGGWSGRDLMGHIVLWQEAALAAARELALGPESAALARLGELSEAGVDEMNAGGLERFRRMPVADVRAAFLSTAGDLRGYLTVVPEIRWIKDAAHQDAFLGETLEHYGEHLATLRAILDAAR